MKNTKNNFGNYLTSFIRKLPLIKGQLKYLVVFNATFHILLDYNQGTQEKNFFSKSQQSSRRTNIATVCIRSTLQINVISRFLLLILKVINRFLWASTKLWTYWYEFTHPN